MRAIRPQGREARNRGAAVVEPGICQETWETWRLLWLQWWLHLWLQLWLRLLLWMSLLLLLLLLPSTSSLCLTSSTCGVAASVQSKSQIMDRRPPRPPLLSAADAECSPCDGVQQHPVLFALHIRRTQLQLAEAILVRAGILLRHHDRWDYCRTDPRKCRIRHLDRGLVLGPADVPAPTLGSDLGWRLGLDLGLNDWSHGLLLDPGLSRLRLILK
mmetsp:Transcript_53237/g.113764  ORF Transcript_53237/g.113764 Transcript_53237/m.113764 type:complete len:215 (-) Transcript_53237:1576-2220(-)